MPLSAACLTSTCIKPHPFLQPTWCFMTLMPSWTSSGCWRWVLARAAAAAALLPASTASWNQSSSFPLRIQAVQHTPAFLALPDAGCAHCAGHPRADGHPRATSGACHGGQPHALPCGGAQQRGSCLVRLVASHIWLENSRQLAGPAVWYPACGIPHAVAVISKVDMEQQAGLEG